MVATKFKLPLLFIALLEMLSSVVYANQSYVRQFEEDLKRADNIVLARINSVNHVWGQIKGKDKRCGVSIDVSVDHAFRGVDKSFTLFVNDFNRQFVPGERYLILGAKNQHFNQYGDNKISYCQLNLLDVDGKALPENGVVDLSQFEFTDRNVLGTGIYSIDPYLASKVGGDWLTGLGVSYGDADTQFVDENENPEQIEPYVGIYLLDILKKHWAIISAPKVE